LTPDGDSIDVSHRQIAVGTDKPSTVDEPAFSMGEAIERIYQFLERIVAVEHPTKCSLSSIAMASDFAA
jgi:hypothetical protein